MRPPNNAVLSVRQMQAAEQALVDTGTSIDELMQRAGRGAAEWVWRIAAGRSVTVLCGPGNNGGDGYVIAETLRARGVPVRLVAPMAPATDAAHTARRQFAGDVLTSDDGASGGLFVDCLFGSGLSRPLSDDLTAPLERLARLHDYRIAVDLPSGVDADTGAVLSAVPRFDLTIALGAWKRAHFLMPAMERMGELRLVDIGIEVDETAFRIERPILHPPAMKAHKYRRGLLAIVGGAMPGAALLSATAAMRAGAGYVKLLAEHSHPAATSDLVIDNRTLREAAADPRIDALLIGPGLGRDERARGQLEQVLQRGTSAVLDADALMLLTPGMIGKRAAPLILTPHDGELAALAHSFGVDSTLGKVERATACAAAIGAVVVGKGPDTIVAAPDGRIGFAGRASSWLSVAGTGDVLAGTIASRLANGREPFVAACEGVWLHSEAARIAGPAFAAATLAERISDAYGATL